MVIMLYSFSNHTRFIKLVLSVSKCDLKSTLPLLKTPFSHTPSKTSSVPGIQYLPSPSRMPLFHSPTNRFPSGNKRSPS
uniref:Uncharacterized protein n=1 Tax=Lepeophtheirus salmonis TaxID=72036 RepID=A0A0K2T9Z5_LEPSM